MTTNIPWLNPVSNIHAAHGEPIYSATWAAWIHLRNFSELLGFQWGFSAKDLRQDAMERNLQFIKSLCTFRPSEEGWRRTFLLRLYKHDDKLKVLIIVRSIAETFENAMNSAMMSWFQVKSTYPYDYVLVPMSEFEFTESVSQHSQNSHIEANHVTVFYPYIRIPMTDKNNTSMGFWSGSETSLELIWRALSNSQIPVALEIYLQPALILEDEWATLNAQKNAIQKEQTEKTDRNLIPREWLDTFSNRFFNLHQPYLMQLRMFGPQFIPSYIESVIGSSLTFPPSYLNSYETLRPAPEQLPYWQNCIENHELINCGSLLSIPARLPYLATLQEVTKIFRAPFLPKEGIPDLKIDLAKKD